MAKELKYSKNVAEALNTLARKQAIHNLFKNIAQDLMVCKLEELDPTEYITELKKEIDHDRRRVF